MAASRQPVETTTGVTVRVEAARRLADVALRGMSLRDALAAPFAGSLGTRDRAFLAALLFEGARWWWRYDGALATLLERPLPARVAAVRALLVLAMVQIARLDIPPHAVVASSVDAARQLGAAHHAGLVNAVLRRFLRERAALEAGLDADPVTRHAHPRWLIDAIVSDWPEDADAILVANNVAAPLTLRVNRRRAARADVQSRLAAAGIAAKEHPVAPGALVLEASTDVTRLPGFAEGLFSVQDAAAQQAALLLAPATGQRVLDACAAPGGKAAHILETVEVELLALDADAARAARIAPALARLGLAATIRVGDAASPRDWWDGRPFDRILVDAPCSATGVIRRQPDIKLHRRAADIAPLARRQAALVRALWPMLAPGGRLVYATCSVLRAENESVPAHLVRFDDARPVALPEFPGVRAGAGHQIFPGHLGMDGFYYAVLDKRG